MPRYLPFGLWLWCVACGNDPLRPASLQHGLTCETSAFAQGGNDGGSDTLLRFWNRGTEFLGFSVVAPRLLEALYDSAGRPLILASISEDRDSEGSGVGVLAVQFRDGSLTSTGFQIAPDHAQHFQSRDLRAYRRFEGPPYMTTIISGDSGRANVVSRTPELLLREDVKKARMLAAALWKLRCP